MLEVCPKEICTGCSACCNVCPKSSISMEYDSDGSLYPKINQKTCVECGLCQKVCAAKNNSWFHKPIEVYAAWAKDENERKTSSSGGAAAVFSKKILENEGVIFGAVFDKNNELHHTLVKKADDIKKMKGSKYVQSKIDDTYKQTKEQLQLNKKVIFFGTPCQIDGLIHYLGKDYSNLITVDLICHGTPSPKYLEEHIAHIENKIGKKAKKVTFRGENDFSFTLYDAEDKVIYKVFRDYDTYFKGFLEGLFYRQNCYKCKYARKERVADITIGDFWGLGDEKEFSGDKSNGVSVIILNTDKGKDFFESCKSLFKFEKRTLEEAVKGNHNLRKPTLLHEKYELFKENYSQYGFEKAVKKCMGNKIFLIGNIRSTLGKIKRMITKNTF